MVRAEVAGVHGAGDVGEAGGDAADGNGEAGPAGTAGADDEEGEGESAWAGGGGNSGSMGGGTGKEGGSDRGRGQLLPVRWALVAGDAGSVMVAGGVGDGGAVVVVV